MPFGIHEETKANEDHYQVNVGGFVPGFMNTVINRAIVTHHSVIPRHAGCSLRRRQATRLLGSGPFPPESGPGSRESVTSRTWTTSAFVISCRPVGFRKRRGTRSFPPSPPPPPFQCLNGRDAATAPVPPPRVSGAGLPSPPPRCVTARPRPRPGPGPDPRRAARAALPESSAARPSPPREGGSGPAGASSGGRSRCPRREVHVDLAWK